MSQDMGLIELHLSVARPEVYINPAFIVSISRSKPVAGSEARSEVDLAWTIPIHVLESPEEVIARIAAVTGGVESNNNARPSP